MTLVYKRFSSLSRIIKAVAYIGVGMAENEVAGAELPLDSAGVKLLRGREAAGLTRAQLAAITRIPERWLVAIEAGDFAALPARTYAVGFSRTYARAVGLDEKDVIAAVRAELGAQSAHDDLRAPATFEPGDPARVPSSRLAWLAALTVVVVLLGLFAFWRSYIAPAGSLPSLLPADQPVQPAAPVPAAPAPQPKDGPVVFTALANGVWVKFYDGAGNQLLQKELAQGESYTVPAGMADVKLWTARPDALGITIGGQPVAKLADSQRTMKDVPVTAAALLARGTAAAPVPAQEAAPVPSMVPAPRRSPAPRSSATPAAEAAGTAATPSPAASPTPAPEAAPLSPLN